jgi:MFS family permease
VSVAGNWMQNTAITWLVLQITGSGTAVGVVLAARYGPTLLLGPYGGLLADRRNGRALLLWSQVVAGVASAAMALSVVTHTDRLWVLYLLALGLGLANVVANPVRQTMVNELVPRDLVPNAVALNSISGNVARVIGPMISGFLIAGIGVAWCFAIDAVSFLGVVVSVLLLRADQLYQATPAAPARRQLREGFAYMWRTPTIMLPMAMIAIVGTFAWEFQVSLPLFAQNTFHGGAELYGVMMAATGVGATAAGLYLAHINAANLRASSVSAIILGVALAVAAATPNIASALAVLVVVGWGTVAFNTRAKSVLQLRASPRMRGRVMAVWAVAWNGSTPIGGPIVGWLGQQYGGRWSLVAGSVPTLLIGVYSLGRARGQDEQAGDGGGEPVVGSAGPIPLET